MARSKRSPANLCDVGEENSFTANTSRYSSTRKVKIQHGGEKVVKEKFAAERQERISAKPLVPMNAKQKAYIAAISECNLILATGYAGTSKTYIPTTMACDAYLKGDIKKIYLTRPNISNSKSLGFFGGDLNQKMTNWLGPILSILKERLGAPELEIAIKHGDIEFIPFEVIKGRSFGKDTFVLVDESEDMTKDEAIKIVTRMGGCTMVLAGDILQSELKESNGLSFLIGKIKKHPHLAKTTGWIDFNEHSDIVRSKECKDWIVAMSKDGDM